MMAFVQELVPLVLPPYQLSLNSRRCQKASCGRVSTAGGSSARHESPGLLSVRKMVAENLWREFFSDPSQWWDHRSEKANPRYPDFKHKKTQQSLWLDNKSTPPWVEAELAAMAPETLKSNIFSWNAKLQRHVKAQDYQKTVELFRQMLEEGIEPNSFTFIPVLNACSTLRSLEEGRRVHVHIMETGYECHVFVGSCLVDMYAKCGSLEDAQRVFDKMPTRNVVTWSAMILGYVKCCEGQVALKLYQQMQQEDVDPDPITFLAVLNACSSVTALEEGRRVHQQIIERGYECDVLVGNCLVDMYVKCGSIEDASRVFSKMPTRDVVAWNVMILGYVKYGEGQKALRLYHQMQKVGVDPEPVTFTAVLNACASVGALDEGRCVHKNIIERGYDHDVVVGSCLVDMYAKCGSIKDAWRVFSKMPLRNVVSWNSIILGYAKCGEGQQALQLYEQMQQEGLDPDPVTYVAVLNACASTVALERGRSVHKQIIERGYEYEVVVGNCLVHMYAKCRSMDDAQRVFNKMPTRDVVAWDVMILGYLNCGDGQRALRLYQQMEQEVVNPEPATFVAVLNACASLATLKEGRCVHKQIIERGYEHDVFVGSCLVNMYAKCGSIEDARRVFNRFSTCDVVMWSAMIMGYVKCGQGQTALELYQQMQQEGVDPDSVTFVAVLNACASIEALEEGRCLHEQIIEGGYECDEFICSSLVDMYAKCGSLEDAQRVFNNMPTKDLVSWNAMLAGYGRHGYAKEALNCFRQMCGVVDVNGVTFLCLLSACSHGGLVDDGLYHFKSMAAVFNISPTVEHYVCVVDLLGRAGRLQEAEDLIISMPCEPAALLWMSLLGACRNHGSVEIGERVAHRVLELDPGNAECYVLLSNIYSAASKWDSSASIHGKSLGSM